MKNNDKFECKFIEDFFKDEYFKLDQLLDGRALTYWNDIHRKSNSQTLDDIRIIYSYLRFEEDYRDLYFKDLIKAFDHLYIFDLSASEIEGLSSRSIANLTEYNSIIENFENEFAKIKDELVLKVEEATKNIIKSLRLS